LDEIKLLHVILPCKKTTFSKNIHRWFSHICFFQPAMFTKGLPGAFGRLPAFEPPRLCLAGTCSHLVTRHCAGLSDWRRWAGSTGISRVNMVPSGND
jgi:hypothetical protein